MTKVAILDDYQNVAKEVADWSQLPDDVKVTQFNDFLGYDEAEMAARLAPYNVLVCMRERTKFPASLIDRLLNLKLIVTTGMRNRAMDMDHAKSKGILVCGTGILPYPAFEHTWALLLACAKEIPKEDAGMKAGKWQVSFPTGLRGKTLGVLGLGKLGAQSAAMGQAFGMNVIAWSENLTAERAAECGVVRVEKDALFQQADFLTVHILLSDRTRGLVGARELSLMKPTAHLINTSRGPIIDEDALVEALNTGTIKSAGIDVYGVEPLPADAPIRKCANAVLTGHTGYVMEENYKAMYPDAVEDILGWLKGAPVRVLNGD